MKNYFSRILLFAIPFSIQTYLLFNHLLPKKISVYGTNDDALIASFANDPDLGISQDNWIFIKSLLSIPITYFQRVLPDVGIYGITLGLTIIISTSAIYLIFDFIPNYFTKIIYIITYTVVVIVFSSIALINPTYTGAAIFAGASGFALLGFLIFNQNSKIIDLGIVAFFLTSISYLIRSESFLLTLGFYIPLIGFYMFWNKNIKLNLKNLILPSSLFLLIFIINFGLDRDNYGSVEWQKYLDLNELRHSVQSRTAEQYLDKNIASSGWSEENFDMFQKFSMYDEAILNATEINKLVVASSPTRGVPAFLNSIPTEEIKEIYYSYFTFGGFDWIGQIIILLICVLLLSLGRKSINLVIYLFIISFISLFINYILNVSYHLPPRITLNFLFLFSISLILMASLEAMKLKSNSYYLKFSCGLALLSLIIFTNVQFPKELNAKIAVNQNQIKLFNLQKNAIKDLRLQDQNLILIGNGSRILTYYQNPYKGFKNIDIADQTIISGWHNLSPNSKEKILALDLESNNFHLEILANSNIIWIDSAEDQIVLKKYFQQFSKNPVIVEDTGYLGDPFYRIYKISTVN